MRVRYDAEVDILYITTGKGPVADSEEICEDVRLERNKNGKIVAIEIMNARRSVGRALAQTIAQRIRAIAA